MGGVAYSEIRAMWQLHARETVAFACSPDLYTRRTRQTQPDMPYTPPIPVISQAK